MISIFHFAEVFQYYAEVFFHFVEVFANVLCQSVSYSSKFTWKFIVFATESLEIIELNFPLYYMRSDVCDMFNCSVTLCSITHSKVLSYREYDHSYYFATSLVDMSR